MWGKKPPRLGQERKDKEAKKSNLYDPEVGERNREYTGEMNECPYCGSDSLSSIENGKRSRCNKCCTNFSATVGTEYHNSGLSKEQILKLKECALAGLSIRKSAELAGVDKDTAHKYLRICTEQRSNQPDDAISRHLTEVRAREAFNRLQQDLLDEQD
jgi:transposase-like protein